MNKIMIQEIEDLLKREAEAVMHIPATGDFLKAVDIIYQCVHVNKGRVIASGMGKAGQIAENIATTFSSTATPATFLHPSEAQHGDLGVMRENDVLLVLSNSGRTQEIMELVALTHNLYEDIPVIVITGNPEGKLPHIADVTIYTGNPAEVCPLGLTPTTSTTTMTVIGDILVVLLMKKISFRPSIMPNVTMAGIWAINHETRQTTMRILKEHSAGMIMDIQEKLFPHIHEHERLADKTEILIRGLKILDIPLMVTEQYTKGLGFTIPAIKACLGPERPYEKMSFSCCDDPEILLQVNNLDRKNMIIAGIEAHVCVLQTAVDLLENGFLPVVVEDCVSSRKPGDKAVAIERMRQEGAVITTCESVLFELARVSGNDPFRAISALVKSMS